MMASPVESCFFSKFDNARVVLLVLLSVVVVAFLGTSPALLGIRSCSCLPEAFAARFCGALAPCLPVAFPLSFAECRALPESSAHTPLLGRTSAAKVNMATRNFGGTLTGLSSELSMRTYYACAKDANRSWHKL